jgi:DNA phosphorothioation-associated putative methyltransferase
VFFVFRDKTLEQRFQAKRFRGRIRLSPPPFAPRLPRAVRPVAQRPTRPDLYELHRTRFEALWQQWLDLGREPEELEIPESAELIAAAGSLRRALRLVISQHDERQLLQARHQRSEDLLVYLALQEFRRCRPFRQLEARLQRDVRALFGDYRSAREQARQLLHQVASPEILDQSCRQAAKSGLGFLEDSQSLQLHSSLIPRLPAVLRVYVGCAEVVYGDISQVDIVKIHIRSGKVSLLKFDDFLTSPLPRLIVRVKINLRGLDVQLFEYRDQFAAPYLYLKSRYLNEEMPGYSEQLTFDERLQSLNIVDLAGYGPSPGQFEAALSEARWKVDGFLLAREDTIPELDARCGKYLTYRDLVQCGETQVRLNISNLPKSPESYTALHDLATLILDPIIEYFGSINLAYGFCSAELSKNIRGRVAPALDQHAAHERKRSGSPICARLGAAADFLVENENMREVADWIADNLPFDRLYYYKPDRPIHVSYGPEAKREFVEMCSTENGRLVPRIRKID